MTRIFCGLLLLGALFGNTCYAKKNKSSKFKGIVRRSPKRNDSFRSKSMKFPDKFGYDPKGKKK